MAFDTVLSYLILLTWHSFCFRVSPELFYLALFHYPPFLTLSRSEHFVGLEWWAEYRVANQKGPFELVQSLCATSLLLSAFLCKGQVHRPSFWCPPPQCTLSCASLDFWTQGQVQPYYWVVLEFLEPLVLLRHFFASPNMACFTLPRLTFQIY